MVGSIIAYAGLTIPEGYLVCDGSAVSRDDYAALFDVIGTTYGSGDGSTTFNLPNLVGKLSMGFSQSYPVGSSGGDATVTLSVNELASHSHDVPAHGHGNDLSISTPKLTHTVTQPMFQYNVCNGGNSTMYSSGRAHYTSVTSAAMTRSTNMSITDHASADCTMSGGVTDAPAFDTESAGSGLGHNNMMPYLALTYLIYSPVTVHEPGMVYYNGFYITGPNGGYFTGKGV